MYAESSSCGVPGRQTQQHHHDQCHARVLHAFAAPAAAPRAATHEASLISSSLVRLPCVRTITVCRRLQGKCTCEVDEQKQWQTKNCRSSKARYARAVQPSVTEGKLVCHRRQASLILVQRCGLRDDYQNTRRCGILTGRTLEASHRASPAKARGVCVCRRKFSTLDLAAFFSSSSSSSCKHSLPHLNPAKSTHPCGTCIPSTSFLLWVAYSRGDCRLCALDSIANGRLSAAAASCAGTTTAITIAIA